MANHGPNRGRRLRVAISRFAAMLISEAKDVAGLSYSAIDEALGLEQGQAFRYAQYPITAKTRAPQAQSIQNLENRIAFLLGRPAHELVVENNSLLREHASCDSELLTIGTPSDKLDWKEIECDDLEIGYRGDWPTYRRLNHSRLLRGGFESIHALIERQARFDEWPESIALYAWQWGTLWAKGIPWVTKAGLGFSSDTPTEKVIAITVRQGLIARRMHLERGNQLVAAGILPDCLSYLETPEMIKSD